ncbi:MAG: DUF523 domain-containing protein [Acidimicrobiales bacterium]
MAGADHLPTLADIEGWPDFTQNDPMRLLVSACLLGVPCGADGTSYGAPYWHIQRLLGLPNIAVVASCPEDLVFGTPRETPDIHGGTGWDVLDGKARVLSNSGRDWTEPMVRAANAMLAVAQHHKIHLALLTDISAACGSQVIYRGARSEGMHQAGQGVCAALLIRHGFKVVSHRDHRSLGRVMRKLDPSVELDPAARDHHESDWYVQHLGPRAGSP